MKIIENFKETETVNYIKIEKDGFEYEAGQYVMLSLDGDSKPFTLASSPTEDFIMIATKLSEGTFKIHFSQLKENDDAEIRGPFGKFTLQQGKHHIMIAGGIGITPFRSMIKYATDKQLDLEIILLHSNKTNTDVAFFNDLRDMAKMNHKLKLVYTVTRPEESKDWKGRTGRIDSNMIKEFMKEETVYYICGPPAMVSETMETLKSLGIEHKKIKTEIFSGY